MRRGASVALAGCAVALACCVAETDSSRAPRIHDLSFAASAPAPAPKTELDRFRAATGFRDPRRWFSFDVDKSVVTESLRRIYFEKERVTLALLAHRGGGEGQQAAPMRYPDGTTFVAERLAPSGAVLDTEVLVTRASGKPDFLLFSWEGSRLDTFAQPNDPPGGPAPGNVPRVCESCHLGESFFDPMQSFPNDPPERRVAIDPRYRDPKIVLRFLEGFHRGDALFGPYGSIWLSKLRADARDGALA